MNFYSLWIVLFVALFMLGARSLLFLQGRRMIPALLAVISVGIVGARGMQLEPDMVTAAHISATAIVWVSAVTMLLMMPVIVMLSLAKRSQIQPLWQITAGFLGGIAGALFVFFGRFYVQSILRIDA